VGYHRAGFDVVGVDIKPQPRYPFPFVQADALEYLAGHGHEFDAIHASFPCQRFSELTPGPHREAHPDLLTPGLNMLRQSGRAYVVENVAGARRLMLNPLMLCGSMFGLPIWRHRYFENNFGLIFPPACCAHDVCPVVVSGVSRRPTPLIRISGRGMRKVAGHRRKENTADEKRRAMGIDWMIETEVTEAIPPAYTEFIGRQLLASLGRVAA
jgi:DNA (cytosine-5)-methyltransferase 1